MVRNRETVGHKVGKDMRKNGMLLLSLLVVIVVGAVDASDFPEGQVKDIQFSVERIDIVHTTDLAIKGEVITIVDQPLTFSLLALQGGVLAGLGIPVSDLPEGFITQFRFVVTGATIVIDGFASEIIVPGGVLRLVGVLQVPEQDAIFVFDADKSVIRKGTGGFILKPVIIFETTTPVGVSDQSNDPETSTSFGCSDTGLSLYQSFTPTASPLVAVELRLRAGGSFPAEGVDTAIQIRSGSPVGTVLGTATTFVEGPQVGGTQLLVLFSFSPAITLTLGDTYVIEWLSPAPAGVNADAILTWMGITDNPYPGGNMFGCTGTEVPSNDLNFRTFTSG